MQPKVILNDSMPFNIKSRKLRSWWFKEYENLSHIKRNIEFRLLQG